MNIPSGTELVNFLASLGVTASEATATINVNAAVAEFESRTGYTPFLDNTSASSSRTFTLEARVLDLEGAALSVSVVSVDGVVLTEGTDYNLIRFSSVGPVRQIEFTNRYGSKTNGVVVTAVWGYCSDLPADVYKAILKGAAAMSLQDLQGPNGAILREKAGPVEFQYAADQGQSTISQFQGEFDSVIARYSRSTL